MLDNFKIGHWSDKEKGTGVTAIICEKGATGGCSIKGAAPATRETDLFRVDKTVQKIHAITLSGGSAFGLEAASGVMQYLYEKGVGFDTGTHKVPIVAGASLYDLDYKEFAYPDKKSGYLAAKAAKSENFEQGEIGAGTGATVGKVLRMKGCMKSSLGVDTLKKDGVEIGVVVAVNALGDIIDENKKIIAGLRVGNKFIGSSKFYNTYKIFLKKQNTTLACIMTNAKLNKAEANKLADIAHQGYKKAIRPSHTMFDGDAIFVMASGEKKVDFDKLCSETIELVAKTIREVEYSDYVQ